MDAKVVTLLKEAWKAIDYLMNHPFPSMHAINDITDVKGRIEEAINAEEKNNPDSKHDDQG